MYKLHEVIKLEKIAKIIGKKKHNQKNRRSDTFFREKLVLIFYFQKLIFEFNNYENYS